MHKLLKAKQELIEIQKKRIEFLSSTTSTSSKKNPTMAALAATVASAGAGASTSLVQSHPSLAYSLHSYQPKLKPKSGVTAAATVKAATATAPPNPQSVMMMMMTSSASNPNLHAAAADQNGTHLVPLVVTKLGRTGSRREGCDMHRILTPLKADKSNHQIAASPSSSSSSMTQFCSYLAANSLHPSNRVGAKPVSSAPQQSGSPSSSTSSSTSSTLSSSIQAHSAATRSQSGFLRASEL